MMFFSGKLGFTLLAAVGGIYFFSNSVQAQDSRVASVVQETAVLEVQSAAPVDWAAWAQWAGVSTETLHRFNPAAANATTGQWNLQIPVASALKTENCAGCLQLMHRVGAKEGLYRIGLWYGNQPAAAIRQRNGLRTDALTIGQQLIMGYLPPLPEAPAAVRQVPAKAVEAPRTVDPVAGKDSAVEVAEARDDPAAALTPKLTYEGPGFFEAEWQQQQAQRLQPVKAATFKTESGWQDGRFYVLINDIPSGTVLRVTHTRNQRSLYAKVVGPLPNIRQNQGLRLRLSSAATALLQEGDEDVFEVLVQH